MPEPVALFFALVILYALVIAEGLLTAAAYRIVRRKPDAGKAWFARWEARLNRLAQRPWLAICFVAAVALGGRALLLPVLPTHHPLITDEYSYLLAGDTFASGRLTNPPHPMWKHFETIHVLQQPTYMAMYQPAQGLILAAGKKLTGNPWTGVYLSAGALCAALCWMLYGWLPPRWAVFGSLLFAIRIGIFSYWMNSYWGGAPAGIGGALVLGSLARLRRTWQVRHALLFGLGVSLLGASRPFEATLTAIPATALLLYWMFGPGRPPLRVSLVRVALPIALVGACVAAGLMVYYQAVTGSPFRMPYVVQRAVYAPAQYFFWQSAGPIPEYRHAALRDFYIGWELNEFNSSLTLPGAIANTGMKLVSVWLFFFGPLLTVPLLFLPRALRSRRLRPLLLLGAFVVAGQSLTVWFYPHYAAPIAGVLFALVVQGVRYLRLWRREQGTGLAMARALPIVCVAFLAVRLAAQPLGLYFPPAWPMTWFHTPEGNLGRAKVNADLRARGGQHLVIVRYGPAHRAVMNEWVYNDADIDRSPVVFAREMDPASNNDLIRYFQGRTVWLVEADSEPPKLTFYPHNR